MRSLILLVAFLGITTQARGLAIDQGNNTDLAAELATLQRKLDDLTTEVEVRKNAHVAVHVHGQAEKHEVTHNEGSHVHVHMHMNKHKDEQNHDSQGNEHDHTGHHHSDHTGHNHNNDHGNHHSDHDDHHHSDHYQHHHVHHHHHSDHGDHHISGHDNHHNDHHDHHHSDHDSHHHSDHVDHHHSDHGYHHHHHSDHKDHHHEEEHGNHSHHSGDNKGKHGCCCMEKGRKHMHFPDQSTDKYMYGRCEVAMNTALESSPHDITGSVFFRQKMGDPLEIIFHVSGFYVPSNAHDDHTLHMHGIHVHEFGDFSNGCQTFGGHFNPHGADHGSKDAGERHVGDWGNIVCDDQGEVHANMTDSHTSLVGTHSIVGKGIVIHEHPDDLGQGGAEGSLQTGNAGGRLACCTVVWSADLDWDKLLRHGH